MSSRTVLLLLVCFLAVSYSPALAQDEPCDWAYLFNWKPNFDVGKVHVGSVYNRSNDRISLMGIGAEKFLNNNWGVQLNLDLGIDNATQKDSVRTIDNNVFDLGLRVGANYYFQGKDKQISPFFGGWASYSMLSEKTKDTPVSGTGNYENTYTANSIGIGITGGVFWQPWKDMDFDLGASYNLGAIISPSSKLKITTGNQTIETDGPSRFMLGDCGGQITARWSF